MPTDKSSLRIQLRDQAQAMAADMRQTASELTCARMLDTPWFKGSNIIMLYAPTEYELDVTLLARECERTGRRVCVAQTNWEEKTLYPAMIDHWDGPWDVGRYGIRQPPASAITLNPCEIDLIVVPGLAFDRHRMRLGRGAGLYDRFLAQADVRAAKVGIGFDWQLLAEIPAFDHDQRLDGVVVESEVI